MKAIIPIIILFIALIIMGFYMVNYLEKSSDDMVSSLNNLEKAIDKENWEKAKKEIKLLHNKWTKYQSYWYIMINHDEIDNIQLSLMHIREYVKTENLSESKAEIGGLKLFLINIPENERLTIQNIL